MPHSKCFTCDKRIPSNHRSFKVTLSSVYQFVSDWACASGLELEESEVVCGPCYFKCIKAEKNGTIAEFSSRHQPEPQEHEIPATPYVGNEQHEQHEMEWETSESSQTSQDPSQASTSNSMASASTSINQFKVSSSVKTQCRCFICKSTAGRSKVPSTAIMNIWLEKSIYISPSNRCCKNHLDGDGIFTTEAQDAIKDQTKPTILSAQETATFIEALTQESRKTPAADLKFSFAQDSTLSEEDYKLLTGLTKAEFDNLSSYCIPHLRNSTNRTTRDVLAIILMKLRLDLSQHILAFLFQLTQPQISEAIASVLKILEHTFIDQHLGYQHISRNDLISEHTPNYVKKILGADENAAVVVMDGTYLYIEKSSIIQKKTFSMHKMRNLVKPMMTVAPDGYILQVDGLYYADGQNNDASILKNMLVRSDFCHFFIENDQLVLDRGFRDAIADARRSGFQTFMPNLLGKSEKQFTAIKANESRKVTMIRWVVESVNGRIKNVFKFFKNVIPITYLPKLGSLFRLACAISNAYFPPLLTERAEHEWIATEVLRKAPLENTLLEEIKDTMKKEVCWTLVTEEGVPGFPYPTEEELKKITLGVYQLDMAPVYASLHIGDKSEFLTYIHKDKPNLLRAKIESRFSKTKKYKLWIEYDPTKFGLESILRYCCLCNVGARVVGTCSHVTSVLWYMGHARYIPHLKLPSQSLAVNILNAKMNESDEDFVPVHI